MDLIVVKGLHNCDIFVPLVNSPYLVALSEPNGDEAQYLTNNKYLY
jgi:hypothetical protein